MSRFYNAYIDSSDFIKKWNSFDGDFGRQKKLLESVANHNYKLLKDNRTKPRISYKYTFDDFIKEINPRLKDTIQQQGEVILEDLTTDGAIMKYTKLGGKVIALNFANGYHVGGGYKLGARAQEEDLCRQYPRLYMSLSHAQSELGLYPIRLDNILITHNIERLRENVEEGYKEVQYIDTTVGFITAAAPNMNRQEYADKTFDYLKIEIVKMLELIFTTPKFSGEDYNVLIIGAIGMGAFAPIDPVKSLEYRTELAALMAKYVSHYRRLYDVISVAIPNKKDKNYQIFKKAFENVDGVLFL